MSTTNVYFVSSRSNYKTVPGFNCFDEKRNALVNPPLSPSIYHPPCRLFSKLRAFSTAPVTEKYLAHWAMYFVRVYGGVVEHPFDSQLWQIYGINKVGKVDEFGGFWYIIDQHWFGFPTRKRTGLYIVGCKLSELPRLPLKLYYPLRKFDNLSKKQRSETTLALIAWLQEVILIIKSKK